MQYPHPALTQKLWIVLLAIAVVLSPGLQVAAQSNAATPEATPIIGTEMIVPWFEETDCMYELPEGLTTDDVMCGWVTAAMYPEQNRSETIHLPIIRILARTENPAPEPLFILLGGPGQDMSTVLPIFGNEFPLWDFMRDRQDVILFDQRGMGQSVPSLACPFERPGKQLADLAPLEQGFAILQCGPALMLDGIDPAAFTTANNAADVDAIRQALGYERIDVYGISYGSKLALSVIRDYPDSVRSTIISSPLPLEANPMADQTVGFNDALLHLWDTCAADPICAAANPDPAGDFVRAVNRLREDPVTITAIDPISGDAQDVVIDNIQFMQMVYLGVFVGSLVPMVPYLVTTVAAGDDSLLNALGSTTLGIGGVPIGVIFTYFCQEETPFATEKETRSEVKTHDLQRPFKDGSWIGLGDQLFAICKMWKYPAAEPIENEAVSSDLPLLIFTGTYDPITPEGNGAIVAANFPNGQWVNFTAMGHDPASFVPECANPIMTAFLNDPYAPVQADCADMPIDFSAPDLDDLMPVEMPDAA